MTDATPHLDFAFEAGKILPRIVAKSATRILGVRKDGGPNDHRGTAAICTFAGRLGFVTANHVLTEMNNTGHYSSVGVSGVVGGFKADYAIFEDIDVAVILPTTEIQLADDCASWPESQADRGKSDSVMASDYMLLYGFPGRFSRFSAFTEGSVSQGYTHCTWVRPRQSQALQAVWQPLAEIPGYPPVADKLLDPWQFCLNFAEKTGPLKTPEGEEVTSAGVLGEHAGLYVDLRTLPGQQPYGAFGLSGSPVWRFGASEAEWSLDRWSPASARLIGIVTHWNDEQSFLIATKFEEVTKRIVG
jgi:hypothetical protein